LAGRAIRANAPKSRLHDEEKTLNSEFGELLNVHMKDLTLELKTYQKFAAFLTSLPTDLSFLEFMGWVIHTVPGPQNLSSPPLHSSVRKIVYTM